MELYAWTLEAWKRGKMHAAYKPAVGLCATLKYLVQEDKEYCEHFSYHTCPDNFPELFKQRTIKRVGGFDKWFNTKKERIQALKNILNK